MHRFLVVYLPFALAACGGAQTTGSAPDSSEMSSSSVSSSAQTSTSGSTSASANGGAQAGETNNPADSADGDTNDAGEFKVKKSDKASRPEQAKLKATDTLAAVRFFVVDKNEEQSPIEGIVISLTSPSGKKYYTEETDANGFAEVLVPIGQSYELVYLSLGRRNVSAKVKVEDKPNLNLKLTLRYKRAEYATGGAKGRPSGFILEDVQFESGKATLTGNSAARLEPIVEYMQHKKSVRIEVSGHTDNVGKKQINKRLSQSRANAVRDYLVSKGIDASRIEAVGYGDERPIASNDTAEGRQKNRRIEAIEK